MKKFGLDFGTTNSCLCRYNVQRKAYECIHFNSQRLDFFPTAIAYGPGGERVIGEAAREYQFDDEYDFYENFKLLLGSGAEAKNGRQRSPSEVMRDFLDELIQELRRMGYIEPRAVPDNLVMTVPDVWKNEETNQIALDNFQDIFTWLGFNAEDNVFFESEPASAAAYYCGLINPAFSGHLVVVDFGGGTLDLTLCRVDEGGERIHVLYRCGNGGESGHSCAGNAFDTAMAHRILQRFAPGREEFGEDTPGFFALRNSFESAKINASAEMRKALKAYYADYDPALGLSYSDSRVIKAAPFGLPKYELTAHDIVEVFEQVNAGALRDALGKMLDHCRQIGLNTDSQTSFRVLLAGGFSNLYCVESEVRRAFHSNDAAADLRFDEGFNINDRSTAIANGAALIASSMVTILPVCQMEIGFCYYDAFDDEVNTEKLIERGEDIKDYLEPRYSSLPMEVSALGQVGALQLYFDDGSERIPVRLEKPLDQMCPLLRIPGNTYQIGLSLGRRQVPILHVRDGQGAEWQESLNRIAETVAQIRAREEGGRETP